jgi:hypothetical protein
VFSTVASNGHVLSKKKLPHPEKDAAVLLMLSFYQTWQALALTIFWPALQPNALAKSGLFCSVPFVRYSPGEWGSVLANSRELSGVAFWHQT